MSTAVSAVSIYAGEWFGFQVWGCTTDPIAHSYLPLTFLPTSAAVAVCELLFVWLLRRTAARVPAQGRWLMIAVCCIYGPSMLEATPSLVQAGHQQQKALALQRLDALEVAFRAVTEQGKGCDGKAAERYYKGPRLRKEDWTKITTGYIEANGFHLMVHCDPDSKTIVSDAIGARNGNETYCRDSHGQSGCRLRAVEGTKRFECVPCR